MAMSKAEMEDNHRRYETCMKLARVAHRDGMYRDAVKFALAAWNHIDGMMQYARRYENTEFDSIEAIDLVLEYAPMLFDHVALDTLESMLKSQRPIERDTAADIGEMLSKAIALMWDAHRMWNYIEERAKPVQDELREKLGGDQARWRSIADAWEKMGLLRRSPDGGSLRIAFMSCLEEVISAKCPSCGEIADAPKAMWLEQMKCFTASETFVIID